MTRLQQLFPVFGAIFAVLYAVVLDYNLALATYLPRQGIWRWGVVPPIPGEGGPAMYWYGVVMTTALVALAMTAAVALIPQRIRQRTSSPSLTWVLPLCSFAFLGWLLSGYYTR
jgi:hypothetical protein